MGESCGKSIIYDRRIPFLWLLLTGSGYDESNDIAGEGAKLFSPHSLNMLEAERIPSQLTQLSATGSRASTPTTGQEGGKGLRTPPNGLTCAGAATPRGGRRDDGRDGVEDTSEGPE